MIVRKATVAEIAGADNLSELAAEYAAESLIDGMPAPATKWETYRALEAAGALHVFAAIADDKLVGFISILAPEMPRYGVAVAVSESFFVLKAHRHTLAGLRLLKAAEDKARELGSPVLLVSAPFEGKLFHVLPRAGYAEVSRIFFKRVAHG